MKKISIIALILLVSCKNSNIETAELKSNKTITNSIMSDNVFKKKLIIILSEKLDNASSKIKVQDYEQNGKLFIPVFSSLEKFTESTQGQVKNEKIEIDGIFLLSVLKGNETLRLNPSLPDEQEFKADELIKKYSTEIEKVKIEVKNLKQ